MTAARFFEAADIVVGALTEFVSGIASLCIPRRAGSTQSVNSIPHAAAWLIALSALLLNPSVSSAQCGGRWLTCIQQSTAGFDGPVNAYAVMPNGDVIAGGSFTSVGDVATPGIARWNGSTWSAMGSIGQVNALAVASNGDLIAGTGVSDSASMGAVLRWNGTSWSQLGLDTQVTGGVNAVAVAPNGDIIAGGWFQSIGGISASCIARWNGSAWSPLGSPVLPNFPIPGLITPGGTPVVYAVTVLSNGDVIAGGTFLSATNTSGIVSTLNVARWNGSAWSPIGAGLRGIPNVVRTLGVLSNGQIVAGGGFYLGTAGIPISSIATWNGSAWLPIGSGNDDTNGGSTIYALRTLSNGDVIIAGDFQVWSGAPLNHIARWNGSTWSAYGTGFDNTVLALAVRSNSDVVAGGTFSTAGSAVATRTARWNGSAWSSLASGLGLNDSITATVTMPNGDVVAAGPFTTANNAPINITGGDHWPGGVARWNGSSWSAMAPIAPVNALAVASSGDLIAGGSFGGGIARLSGSAWTPLGGGVDGPVTAVVRMPNGDVIASGQFFNASGGVAANRIARWNGSSWSPLGSGLNGQAFALAVLSNGDLVAAGGFTNAGGSPANRIARWNGSSWSPFGSGLGNTVRALAVMPNGNLIAGGAFSGTIARWNGSNWSSIGADMYQVFALAVRSNGDLVAGGVFDTAGGVSASNIARWNGSAWSALGSGLGANASAGFTVNPTVAALAALPSGEIFAGGAIATADGAISNYFARWTDTGIPWVTSHPAAQPAVEGESVTLSATCASGYDFNGPVSFQWRHNLVNITDGPGGASIGGGSVTGSSGWLPSPAVDPTSTLTIADTRPSDSGEYTVVFSNTCGSVTSNAAALTVDPGCHADFDKSGFVDTDDFTAFVLAFEAGTDDADFDLSGFVDTDDFTAFVLAFEAGC